MSPAHFLEVDKLGGLFGKTILPELQRRADKAPLLTLEAERDLVARMKGGDRKAFEALYESHIGLAIKVALQHRRSRVDVSNLISAALLGLTIGLQRYNPEHEGNARVNTYVKFWIVNQIRDAIYHNSGIITRPATSMSRHLFWTIPKMLRRLGIVDADRIDDSTMQVLADLCHAPKETVALAIQQLRSDVSLNSVMPSGDGELMDYIVDETDTETEVVERLETQWRVESLRRAMITLTPREQEVIRLRFFGDPQPTFEEVATKLGLSRARVHQLESTGIERLQVALGGMPKTIKQKARVKKDNPANENAPTLARWKAA